MKKVKQGKEKDVKEMLLKQPSLAAEATDVVPPPVPFAPTAILPATPRECKARASYVCAQFS